MPRSKHRRKPGGKAVAHPGRGKSRQLPLSPEDVLWRRFVDGYTKPFHEKYGDSAAGGAGDMLDLIEEGAFVATGGGRLQSVGLSPDGFLGFAGRSFPISACSSLGYLWRTVGR